MIAQALGKMLLNDSKQGRDAMIIHPMITVQDVRRSADWYEKVLGLQSAHGGDEYEQLVQDGRLLLQLHGPEADMNHPPLLKPGEAAGRGVLLWFKTEDFEGQVQRLESAGVVPEVPPYLNEYAAHQEVWFRNPDGYLIVVAGPRAHEKYYAPMP